MQIKSHFHKKGFALGISLKVRDSGTWKWPTEGHPTTLTFLMAIYAVRENT